MSLFVDRSPGVDQSSVTTDLFTISWNDGNLGQGADTTVNGALSGITSIPVAPVTYTSVTTGMASADRLFTLVNNDSGDGLNWSNPIVITPLPGGNDPYFGGSINGNAQVYVDTGVTPAVIHVVYDTSQDGGQGIALFDTNGDAIQSPNAVILYHELSHAFHRAINQSPFPQTACPGDTTDEPAAEIDENVLRAQLGLCLRDVCNHGGEPGFGKACGGSATPGGPPLVDGDAPPEDDGGCFIVTAAMGSAQAWEIWRLRAIRDRIAACSSISSALIAAVYSEYAQFGPAVARAIAPDAHARGAVREFIVRPLFAWYELSEKLALGAAPGDVARAKQAVLGACSSELAPFVVAILEQVSQGEPLPAILDLGSAFDRIAKLPLAAWALLTPLRSAWTGAANRSDLTEAVADWLASAPIDRVGPPPANSLDTELQQLAHFLDFAPQARRILGARLAASWPSTFAELRCHGFLETGGDE
jgi:hypothetical protein